MEQGGEGEDVGLWQSTYKWHISLGMGSLRRIGT